MLRGILLFFCKKKSRKTPKTYYKCIHKVNICNTKRIHLYTSVNKCIRSTSVTVDTKPFWKIKKNIFFSKSDVTFFHLDSSGTAWQVNVFKHSEKTGDVGISLCSYQELPKSHFIFAIVFFCFWFFFFFWFFFQMSATNF